MKDIRVRFAPSPTGLMHLGNVRAALINYLYARQKNGVFIVRVEDTDAERNFDPGARQIIADLHWLGLSYDEGPENDGGYGPYFQSERSYIYQEHLNYLISQNALYRCFCTSEDLEKKRDRQIALKQPPRYDRTCYKLSQEAVQNLLAAGTPFIWRFLINQAESVTIHDLARGDITFELKNYSDFPVTRQDGSFTFMFANCVDDVAMKISHVFRGEDHLSNTGNQAALYKAFGAPLPIFWHLPILCNIEGRKLSKRDFGFSLKDLKDAGYLPEAILNYLAIIGGSFQQEIMSQEELITTLNFEHITTSGHIRYDVQKLNWVNHQWILRTEPEKILEMGLQYLNVAYKDLPALPHEQLVRLVKTVQGELTTIADLVQHSEFLYRQPLNVCELLEQELTPEIIQKIAKVVEQSSSITEAVAFMDAVKSESKLLAVPSKDLFVFLRVALTGALKGPAIVDILNLLGTTERDVRLRAALQSC